MKAIWILFGSFCALASLFVYFLIPETKGMSLEKMDELFGITEDLMRVLDDNQRERAASRAAAGGNDLGLGSLYTTATAIPAFAEESEKKNTGSSRPRDEPPYRL